MTNMRNLPVDHFDGHANLTQHQKNAAGPTLAEQMGLIYDDVEEINSDIDTLNEPLTEYTRYVDLNAPAGGNGSIHRPYQTIQAAVDDVEAIAETAPAWSIFTIKIGAGWYYETVVITGGNPTAYLGLEGEVGTYIWAYGDGIICSNATPASISTWRASRNYADLVAPTIPHMGFAQIKIQNIMITADASAPNCHALAVLGVPGDDTPTTTEFGNVYIEYCSFTAEDNGIYCRNTNIIIVSHSPRSWSTRRIKLDQVRYFLASNFRIYSGIIASYDATDPLGHVKDGFQFLGVQDCSFYNGVLTLGEGITNCAVRSSLIGNNITLNDDCVLECDHSYIGGILDINGTGAHVFKDVTVAGNTDLVGTGNLTASGCKFLGNLTAASGAGVVALNDSPILGSLTDPDDKVTMTRAGVRAGTVTAAGAGDEVIAFASTLGTTRYIITITQEDNGAGATTAVVKSGTKAAGGFTMTVGGAGIFHWKAEMLTA